MAEEICLGHDAHSTVGPAGSCVGNFSSFLVQHHAIAMHSTSRHRTQTPDTENLDPGTLSAEIAINQHEAVFRSCVHFGDSEFATLWCEYSSVPPKQAQETLSSDDSEAAWRWGRDAACSGRCSYKCMIIAEMGKLIPCTFLEFFWGALL